MDGKAMVVCMSRRICVALYDADRRSCAPNGTATMTRPGAIKIVMTGSAVRSARLAAAHRRSKGATRSSGKAREETRTTR